MDLSDPFIKDGDPYIITRTIIEAFKTIKFNDIFKENIKTIINTKPDTFK